MSQTSYIIINITFTSRNLNIVIAVLSVGEGRRIFYSELKGALNTELNVGGEALYSE